MTMQITGSWRLYASPKWGRDADWDNLPRIVFGDGRITLEDGSHPDFTSRKGVLRFSLPAPGEAPERSVANIAIDRGSDGHLQGWRYLSNEPLADLPDPQTHIPDGDRYARIALIREDRFAAFRAEQEGYTAAQRRVLEERDEDTPASATVH